MAYKQNVEEYVEDHIEEIYDSIYENMELGFDEDEDGHTSECIDNFSRLLSEEVEIATDGYFEKYGYTGGDYDTEYDDVEYEVRELIEEKMEGWVTKLISDFHNNETYQREVEEARRGQY